MFKKIILKTVAVYFLSINFIHAAESGGMPQLDPKFWTAQIFWLILIFSSLYLIISKIFLPRITYSIENRKSKIVNDLDEAQKLKDSAGKKFEEYNEIIANSKKVAKDVGFFSKCKTTPVYPGSFNKFKNSRNES